MAERLSLGYLGIIGDREKWRSFACDLYGMQAVDHGDALRLRADEWVWRLSVEDGPVPGLAYLGIEYESAAGLEAAITRLRSAGHEAFEDVALARQRNVGRLFRTRSIDGVELELFIGGLITSAPFASSNGARFITGDRGLGHVLLLVPDLPKALDYYTSLLGLRVSDAVVVAEGIDAYFLNGGCRHHVIAMASIPGKQGLDHLFVEVDNVTTVGTAWDKVVAGAAPIVRALGQHANDPAISFYVQSPSGFAFEYGYGALVIEDEDKWRFKRWDSIYLWGGQVGPAGHL